METVSKMKHPVAGFVLLSNIIFWIFLGVIGACMAFEIPEIITNTLIIIAAWSSTFSFMILFKRIYPKRSFKEYVRKQFETKLKISVLSYVVLSQILIFTLVLFLLQRNAITHDNTFSISSVLILVMNFFVHLVRGPLGEEIGWRGFVQNELQKKYSPLMSAIIIGTLWGFWHTPLWLLSGYTGISLFKYCVLFMIGVISLSIIITFFYNLNRNLLIPITIHQLFNYLLSLIGGDLLVALEYTMLSYFIFAVVIVIANPQKIMFKRNAGYYWNLYDTVQHK